MYTMESNNYYNLKMSESFCSDCKLVLKSIYSVGSASSIINECESLSEISKDRNSLLDEYKTNLNEEIINKNNNNKLKKSQYFSYKDKLPLPILNDNEKNNIQSEGCILSEKKKSSTKELIKMDNNFDNYEKRVINNKPRIIEDRILNNIEQLPINTLKRQKLQISNNKREEEIYFKDSKSCSKIIKPVNKRYCQKEQNKYTDFKSLYKSKTQSKQLIRMNFLEKSKKKSFASKSKKCETDFIKEPDYIVQLNTLKDNILNRRKKILNAAKNLFMLSSYLDDICNTISETKVLNVDVKDTTNTNKSIDLNINKKVDKNTSPISFSERNNPTTVINNNTEMKTNNRDMYTYNPYRVKNNFDKNI